MRAVGLTTDSNETGLVECAHVPTCVLLQGAARIEPVLQVLARGRLAHCPARLQAVLAAPAAQLPWMPSGPGRSKRLHASATPDKGATVVLER